MSDTPLPVVEDSTYGVSVPLNEVERELARQMKALQGEGQAPIVRARMSNLVVYCSLRETADCITAQIPDIGAVHPARVLMLIGDGAGENLQAFVRVRLYSLGSHARAASEQVTIVAPPGQVERLPFAVRALVIGDLPTNLWWASNQPPPFAGSLLYNLADNAQQIIYDSLNWREPARGVAAMATWLEQVERTSGCGRWRVASDLNWRRLKSWRRLLGQSLDAASAPGARASITDVLVEHGPHAIVQAWELVSLLSQQGGWRLHAGSVQTGVEMVWRFTVDKRDVRVRIKRLEKGLPDIFHIRLACTLDKKPAALCFTRESAERLSVQVEGIEGEPRTITLPPVLPAELVGRQLSDRERDPVFRDSMAVAQVMAQSVL